MLDDKREEARLISEMLAQYVAAIFAEARAKEMMKTLEVILQTQEELENGIN